MEIVGKKKIHTLIAILIIVIGFVLMVGKIYFDSEPGAIPLALILFGTGWYFITRFRFRQQKNS